MNYIDFLTAESAVVLVLGFGIGYALKDKVLSRSVKGLINGELMDLLKNIKTMVNDAEIERDRLMIQHEKVERKMGTFEQEQSKFINDRDEEKKAEIERKRKAEKENDEDNSAYKPRTT